MRESSDKEMDSLLRRHGRALAEARAGDGARAAHAAAHLDANELSAFAEGALPAAARLTAVSHLADCEECRGLVVSLARAAGVEGELEKRAGSIQVEPARPARRRAWLSALFAPRVLRYVAPALALCLVAAVSFVALRSWQSSKEVARRASSGEARRDGAARIGEQNGTGVGEQSSSNANLSANVGNASTETTNGEPPAEAASNATVGTPRATQAGKGPNAEGETVSVTAEEPKRAEAPPPPSTNEKESVASDAPAPKPNSNEPTGAAKTESKEKKVRPPDSQEQVAATDQQANLRSNQQRNLETVSPGGTRSQTRSVANNASGGASNNAAGSGMLASTPREDRDKTERPAAAPASRRARSADEKRARTEDDEVVRSEETRSAAGHRFRRDGGAWVDVNYKPSMPSTGVRRGTDAYRALVADIPEIAHVAEQLGGEVVVVIRGRAYRIR